MCPTCLSPLISNIFDKVSVVDRNSLMFLFVDQPEMSSKLTTDQFIDFAGYYLAENPIIG